jgi:3-oxoacyl-[acyl-carrier-protein] synthase II
VAVTGLGLVTPAGTGVEKAWSNVLEGKSCVARIGKFDPVNLKTGIAAEVKDFNAEEYMDKKSARRLDSFIKFAVAASKMALSDSGLAVTPELSPKMGVSLGCGLGGLRTMEENHKILLEGRPDRVSAFFIPMLIGNMSSGQVGIELGLRGPNILCATACAAGTHAIGIAFQNIRDNGYEAMLAGGTEAVITPLAVAGFNAIKALSTRNDEPEKASRPFDRDRDGFVVGEGSGVILLEEMERARARGAKIRAEVLGFGASGDAFHITAPPEDGIGARLAMEAALDDARSLNLSPSDIGYVNAHGTSTELNDRMETLAIKDVFKGHARDLAVSSTKSMTGHLLGAAGGVEAVFSILAIRDGILPPTINLDNPDPACDLDYVPNVKRHKALKAVMSNSFGFGGTNGAVIFGAPDAFG